MKLRILFCALAVGLVLPLQADEVIREAQARLKSMGFYPGSVDGQWGSQTAAAVRRYQLDQGLKITGELNRQTMKSLGISGTGAPPAAPGPQGRAPIPEYKALANIFKGGPYISLGPEVQLQTIREAKKNLQVLGYYNGPIDGSPSPALVAALKAWQRSAGFSQTGRFDENTLKGLDIMPF